MNNYSSSVLEYVQMMCYVSIIRLHSIRAEKKKLLRVAVCY